MREGWQKVRLGDVAHRVIGKTPPRKQARYWEATPGDRPFVSIANMKPNGHIYPTEGITETAEKEGWAKRTPAGSLLLSFKLTIGRVAIADKDLFTNEAIATIFPHDDVLRDYLAIALQGVDWSQLGGRAVKGTTLNKASLDAVPIPLPPLAEQRRIVDLIGAVDEAIEAADAEAEAARGLARSTRNVFFRGGTNTVPMGSVYELTAGKQLQSSNTEGVLTPYIRAGNIGDGFLNLEVMKSMYLTDTEVERLRLQVGDVLVVEGGNGYGKSAVWEGEKAGNVAYQNHVLRLRPISEHYSTEYARQWAQWCHEQGLFQPTGTGIPNIGLRRAREMPIREQSGFQSPREIQLAAASGETEREARATADALRTLRSNLLTVLLSGEHEIPESYDELLTQPTESNTAPALEEVLA